MIDLLPKFINLGGTILLLIATVTWLLSALVRLGDRLLYQFRTSFAGQKNRVVKRHFSKRLGDLAP